MKLTIVRHGETSYNKEGLIQGQSDIPLNDYGRMIARTTKAAYERENIHYDVIYSSPLIRAYETACILKDKGQEIIVDSRLKELSYGKYEGSNYQDILNGSKDLLVIRDCFLNPENYIPDETGESFDAFFARTKSFLEDMQTRYTKGENILVVCHGGTLRALLWAVQPRKLKDFWATKHKNLCHSILSWEAGEPFTILDTGKYYYELDEMEVKKQCQPGIQGGCVAPL